uniref:Uncharacterized protein n=1 Tax=Anguilla anguilla TaxID=7936 RepID=A0A0E9UST8_ANGAN
MTASRTLHRSMGFVHKLIPGAMPTVYPGTTAASVDHLRIHRFCHSQ